jgi:hypothetical protein
MLRFPSRLLAGFSHLASAFHVDFWFLIITGRYATGTPLQTKIKSPE